MSSVRSQEVLVGSTIFVSLREARMESTRISQRRPQFHLLKAATTVVFTMSVLAVQVYPHLELWRLRQNHTIMDSWSVLQKRHYTKRRRLFIEREKVVEYCTLHSKHCQTLLTCPIDWVVILLLNSYWSHTHCTLAGVHSSHNLTWAGRGKVTQINAYPPSLGHGHGTFG